MTSGSGISSLLDFVLFLFNMFKYHLLAMFFGFSVLGIICLPVLSALRGFFLCFSISAMIRLFGSNGIALALSVFGIGTLLTIPCYFILAVQAFSASLNLFKAVRATGGGRVPPVPYGRGYFLLWGVCFLILAVAFLAGVFITPYLTDLAAAKMIA